MRVFLLLSSSGVVFYLWLLVQLYRDGHRNRNQVKVLRDFELDRILETRFTPGRLAATPGAHPSKLSYEEIWLPVTKFEWKPPKEVAQSNRQQPGTLATPVGRVNRS